MLNTRQLARGENFVNLNSCQFNKDRKSLYVASEAFGGGFPHRILIISNHTGREVWFSPAQPGSKHYDEDGWDGEMCVYEPEVPLPNVEYLTVCHEW